MTYINNTNDEIAEAQKVAKKRARIDSNTKDPEGVYKNKASGHLAEKAVHEYAQEMGLDSTWVADETSGEPQHDLIIEGTKVDVKSSTNDARACNLMLSDRITDDSRDNDAFIMVRVTDDLAMCEIYGGVTVEDFNEYSHYFRKTGQHRMMSDELTPIDILVGETRFTFTT